jgi:(1->4)-alpha-D-glucan 1-alpha-D-glucosylmutase
VDYEHRQRMLAQLRGMTPAELLSRLPEGLPKMHVIRRVLMLRASLPDLFARGTYLPIDVVGGHAERVCAFVRRDAVASVVVVVPRLIGPLCGPEGQPPLGDRWGDTRLRMPSGWVADGEMVDVLTDEVHAPAAEMTVAQVLGRFPVAVLTTNRGATEEWLHG